MYKTVCDDEEREWEQEHVREWAKQDQMKIGSFFVHSQCAYDSGDMIMRTICTF